MILYHGTTAIFDKVDSAWFGMNKDFGLGFYTSIENRACLGATVESERCGME